MRETVWVNHRHIGSIYGTNVTGDIGREKTNP